MAEVDDRVRKYVEVTTELVAAAEPCATELAAAEAAGKAAMAAIAEPNNGDSCGGA